MAVGSGSVLVSRLGAGLVDALNTETFPSVLVDSLRSITPIDAAIVAAFPSQRRPRILYDEMGARPRTSRELYLHDLYRRDAVYRACQDRIAQGFYRYRDLAGGAAQVGPCTARRDDTAALVEEATFVAEVGADGHVVFSVYRAPELGEFTSEDCERLAAVAPLVNRALAKHWSCLDAPDGDGDKRAEVALDAGLATFGAAQLSRREKEIVALILKGHSSLSVAHRLGIAEGTVKNHRKNIYAKLSISSQAELFRGFLSSMAAQGRLHA